MVQIKVDSSLHSKELFYKLETLGIQISENACWLLTKSNNGNWLLIDSEKRKLEIDFDQNRLDYQRIHKGSGELIARSLGIKENVKNIIDLTAGLGIDAVFLAQIGFKVTSIERNPVLIFLLREAQKKTQCPKIKMIDWVFSDSKVFLKNYKFLAQTSCYFDPMYPEKKKSALPRQEMVIFRELVGSDEDASTTLALAAGKGFSRTVVKRSVKAPLLLERPDFQLTSKLIRYDVYYPRSTIGDPI